MPETKLVDETHFISRRYGNGKLRREVWVDANGKVVRYNLAYINHLLHSGNNGRVIGYDNAHGRLHRHFCGQVSDLANESFEEIEQRFEQEWLALKIRR